MLKHLKLRTSILLGFAVPITIFIIAALLVIVNIQATEKITRLVNTSRDISQTGSELELSASSIIRGVRGYILTQRKENKDTTEKADKDFQRLLEKLRGLVENTDQETRLSQLESLQKDIMDVVGQEITLIDQSNLAAAIELSKTAKVLDGWTAFREAMNAFSDKQASILQERSAIQAKLLQQLNTIAWSACLLAAIISVILGLWISSRLSRVLMDTVNTLASSSIEISATVEQHERTVLQQTASVSETSATTEELRVSAQTSSNQAENAAEVVRKTLQLAEEGSRSSQRATLSMGDLQDKVRAVAEQILQLSEQAGQIGSIAKVVGDLASETNMLALNAAVEAARAGEQGKGFAVVASEVRKLADQSKKSAERANALVADIQKATNSAVMVAEEGSKTAKEVLNIAIKNGETFHELIGYAETINQNAQQVVFNSRQQAGALSQISEAMKNINAGATEMAAGTKQTKVGLQNLSDVAASLKAII